MKIKQNEAVISSSQSFAVVQDFTQNLATALFIHEQGVQDLKKSSVISGVLGTISNQHPWNFKPS
jgi:poly(3-hydroxyalkanoate) synthetase